MIRKFVCISCPKGCPITVEYNESGIQSISGNTCRRGEAYVMSELTNPKRVLTTTVMTNSGAMLPVRTKSPIPKSLLFECMEEINKIIVDKPIKMGDIIIEDILSTGVSVVASSDYDFKG